MLARTLASAWHEATPLRHLLPAHWNSADCFRAGLGTLRHAGGHALGALILCGIARPLIGQVRGTIQAEANVLPAEGTRTFQLVSQILRPTRPSTIATRHPGDPLPLATIAIDSVAVGPGSTSRRMIVNVQYLQN
jgi:hypothetical protein